MGIHIMPPLYEVVIKGKLYTITVYAEDGDGYLICRDTSFATLRILANATSLDTSSTEMVAGQFDAISYKEIRRAVIPFDTSAIPNAAVITEATLSLYGYASSFVTADPFNLVIVDGNDCADALELADYGVLFSASVSGSSMSVAAFNTTGYNDFALNGDGRSWINKKGMTKLAVRSSFDLSGYNQWGSATFYQADKGWKNAGDHTQGYKPKLTITYRI